MPSSQSFVARNRVLLGTLLVLLTIVLLAGGWSIPYKFQSFSILYKFGKLKLFLRYGKVIGITVVLLLFYQVLLASRLKFMEQIFSARKLLLLHRINGIIITCMIAAHPVLIKASENFISYTFVKKYYPEFVGIALLLILLILSATAIFRNFLKTVKFGFLIQLYVHGILKLILTTIVVFLKNITMKIVYFLFH